MGPGLATRGVLLADFPGQAVPATCGGLRAFLSHPLSPGGPHVPDSRQRGQDARRCLASLRFTRPLQSGGPTALDT